MREPPMRLPRWIEAPAGRVAVRVEREVRNDDGEACWGTYDRTSRRIVVDRTLSARQRWMVMYHEQAHVALIDAGLDNLLVDEKLYEAICDAFASARMRETFR